MDYTIQEVDPTAPGIKEGVDAVLRDGFGAGDLSVSPAERVKVITGTQASRPSLHLAAMLDGQVIGFNSFISHDLLYEGRVINCYQSCFTATSTAHRGKKIFQNLILSAHEILKPRGAAFVFGFPNDNSYPLFTKKLGYRELPSQKVRVLNLPLKRDAFARADAQSLSAMQEGAVLQNDMQLIELKRRKYGQELLTAEVEGSVAWGVRRSTVRHGITVPYLDVGGIAVRSREHLVPVMRQLRKAAGVVAYTQAVTIEGNTFNGLFREVQPAQTNCLIIFDLNMNTERGVSFNFFNGVRDVY